MRSDRKMERLQQAIEERIEEMEQPGYQFPGRFTKGDYLAVAAVAAVCLLALVMGMYV